MDKLHETNQQNSATTHYKRILEGIIEHESHLTKKAQMDKQVRSIWLSCPQSSTSVNANEMFWKLHFEMSKTNTLKKVSFKELRSLPEQEYIFIQISLFHSSLWNPASLMTVCLDLPAQ